MHSFMYYRWSMAEIQRSQSFCNYQAAKMTVKIFLNPVAAVTTASMEVSPLVRSSLAPGLLPGFLSHTVCDKKLGRSLGTRLVEKHTTYTAVEYYFMLHLFTQRYAALVVQNGDSSVTDQCHGTLV